MTRRFISVFLITLFSFGCFSVHEHIEKMENNFKKELDKQAEIIYNKDREINELIYQRNTLQNSVDELERKIEVQRQEEVSRGSGRVITCYASAYTVGDNLTPSSIMANGEIAHVGAVACNFLPIGTQVRIDGNIYTVKDRCGVDGRIDIYMDSYEECMSWGVREVEVELL